MPRDYKPGQIKNKNQLSENFIDKFLMYSSDRHDWVMDPFCGGFTTARQALRRQRRFVGFEMNQHAHDVFVPTLESVEIEPDPVPQSPTAEELARREKMRESWRQDRLRRKQTKVSAD